METHASRSECKIKGYIQTFASIKTKSLLAGRIDEGLCPGWYRWSTQTVSCGLTSRQRRRNARPAVLKGKAALGPVFFQEACPECPGQGRGRQGPGRFIHCCAFSPPLLSVAPPRLSLAFTQSEFDVGLLETRQPIAWPLGCSATNQASLLPVSNYF